MTPQFGHGISAMLLAKHIISRVYKVLRGEPLLW